MTTGQGRAVDLGLADFLKAEEIVDLDACLSRLTAERAQRRQESRESLDAGVSEYEQLAIAGRWNELLALCERQINGNGNGSGAGAVKAQLWWVKAQLVANGMPALMLAAPLEGVCTGVHEGNQTGAVFSTQEQKLFEEVLIEVARKLKNGGEGALAIKFMERAFRIEGGYRRELLDLVTRELSEAKERLRRRKSKRLILWIDDLLKLEKELASNVEGDLQAAPEGQPEAAVPPGEGKKNTKVALLLSGLGATAAVLVAALLLLRSESGFRDPEQTSLELTVIDSKREAQPKLPLPDRLAKSDAPGLSAVWDEIAEQVEKRSPPSAVKATPPPPAILKIEGANEPVELSELRKKPVVEKSSSDAMTFSTETEPVFHGERRGDTIVEGFPPLGGRSLHSEIQDCEVLSKTWVRDRPSESGRGLQEIASGQMVRVVERMGSWLKIMSRSKKEGYLRADATSCP